MFVAIALGGIYLAFISVTEVTKDTFEALSLDARMMPIELQHRLMFSLLEWGWLYPADTLQKTISIQGDCRASCKRHRVTCVFGSHFLAHSRFRAQFYTTLLSPVEK
jgi:hypothetical protein